MGFRIASFVFGWLALFVMSSLGQERLPIEVSPGDRVVQAQRSPDGSVTLSSSGGFHPTAFLVATNPSLSRVRWRAVTSPGDADWVYHGRVTVPSSALNQYFAVSYFPDPLKHNGFVRLPANRPKEELRSGVVVLHPTQLGMNSGKAFEDEIGPFCDIAGLASMFPSAHNSDGQQNRWNGRSGPGASDYKLLYNSIMAMKQSVPAIEEVTLAAYSDGVETAIGFTQMYPQIVRRLFLVAGFNNPRTEQFALAQNNGQPVRFDPPLKVVGVVADRDTEFFPEIKKACEWFAAANGFFGEPTTDPVERDYNAKAPGPDAMILSYGPHVRMIRYGTKVRTHEDSTYESENGFRVFYDRFLRQGIMPGSSDE